jgi:hypothetical protein
MSLFPIFKVNHLKDKDKIDTIFVFYGTHLEINDPDPNELFQKDPTNKAFTDVFDTEERENIQKENIQVVFLKESIHIDDTIGVIKLKIAKAFNTIFSIEEIYMFCLKEETIPPISSYQIITQNEHLPLTKSRFSQLLLNIVDKNIQPVPFDLQDKEIYTFDDILKLDLSKQKYLVSKTLGQKFFILTDDYPIIANPFLITEYDTILERSRKELTTLNNNLLLNTGSIYKNTIYLCLAEDVFQHNETTGISGEYTSKIYYPFLHKMNIDTITQLDANKQKLIQETKNKLKESTLITFENVNMFYDIYEYKKESNLFHENTKYTGIKNIKVVLYPENKIKIPIDIIFKLIHATPSLPFIKFNPATRQENMYRLYTEKLTLDGKKIPYLNKSTILKLVKVIGKTKSVAMYVSVSYNNTLYNLSCEFEESGIITVYPTNDFEKAIPIYEKKKDKYEDINEIIRLAVNPVIDQIKPFFEQSGYKIENFSSIESNHVEVRELVYQTNYQITKEIHLNKIRSCVSSIFAIEKEDFKKGIIMRYKRVSNFNKRDSQQAFVIEKIDQKYSLDEIVQQLIENYDDMNEEKAIEIIDKLRSELQVTRGANKRRSIELKINPGFKTSLQVDLVKSEITIRVDNINDISYLSTIPVYINSFVRITQDIKSTQINIELINKLCSSKRKEIKDIQFDEIVASAEEVLEENEIPMIQEENILYPNDPGFDYEEQSKNIDDLLDILGFEEEEEEELVGGQGEEDESSKSISSEVLTDTTTNSIESLESIEGEIEFTDGEMEFTEDLPVKSNLLDQPDTNIPIIESIEKEEPQETKKEENKEEEEKEKEKEEQVEEIIIPNPKKKKNKKQAQQEEPIVKDSDIKDITNMKIKNPSYFEERIKERFPQLFVTAKDELIDLYSRMCPSASRRQPVILTKEEKDRIIKEHPEDVDPEADFIEYGIDSTESGKENKYYYTCPRYWCLLTNTMVTEQDILSGKCGPPVKKVEDAIIPKSESRVPKNKYVYQFYDANSKNYPGFHKSNTPNGLCIPCCYKTWNIGKQKERRQVCQGQGEMPEDTVKKAPLSEKNVPEDFQEIDHYVKGPDKYPLGEHRWGFLPIAIQKFLNEINEDCQVSKTNANIKPFHTCMLRHGVEINKTQSFLACIASAMFYGDKDETTKQNKLTRFFPESKYDVPTIKEMKQILLDAITIDTFITYQNAELVTIFAKEDLSVNIQNYKNSTLYKKATPSNQAEMVFIIKVAKSFENFRSYLKDPEIAIDYTYLWDMITTPNPKLFERGINLIILEIPENDITNNVNLVCPTNHYSIHTYDSKKRSLFLIKRDNYFEPIYAYTNEETRVKITKTFSELDKNLSSTLRSVFNKIIKPTLGEKCNPLKSIPNRYQFKTPPLLDILLRNLLKKKYKIHKQILNFQGKVIGVTCTNKKGVKGFIPCYPSSLTTLPKSKDCTLENTCTYDYDYMTNDSIWSNYENTISFLKEYYEYEEPTQEAQFGKCIDGTDICKVVDEEMIVGVLTNTNQFVQIDPPLPISQSNDHLKTVNNNNYLIADIQTSTNKNVDTKRVDFIKRIQLETNFYNVFRNTIRILLNDYMNSDKRKEIQNECNNRYVLYEEQLEKVIDLLQELAREHIQFTTKENGFDYHMIEEIHTCISSSTQCNNPNSVCMMTKDTNTCVLILPKENLITNHDNETYYYGKMADELIRYNRIKSFIFKPQSYLSFGPVRYNLKENEIIILQSLLNQEFFENLVPSEMNKYATFNAFDNAEPLITQPYTNEMLLNEVKNKIQGRNCFPTEDTFKTDYWSSCFPKYKKLLYTENKQCTFYLVIDILQKVKNIALTLEDVKNALIEEYNKYPSFEEKTKIVDILIEEFQQDAKLIKEGTLDLEGLIIQDEFYMVNFDLWLLLTKYEIPSIFISSKPIAETRYNKKEFVCYQTPNSNEYVFIIAPSLRNVEYPKYKLVSDMNNNILISIDNIKDGACKENILEAIKHYITIENYIAVYKRETKTMYRSKKPGLRTLPIQEFEILDAPVEELVVTNRIKLPRKKLTQTILLEEDIEPSLIKEAEPTVMEEQEEKAFEIIPKKRQSKKKDIVVNKQKNTRKKK